MLIQNPPLAACSYKRAIIPVSRTSSIRFAGGVDNAQIRVLVVEDNPNYQNGIRTLLMQHGFTVIPEIPDNPTAALAAIRRHRPHVILLDQELRLDRSGYEYGYEILKQLYLEHALVLGKKDWVDGGDIIRKPGFQALASRIIWTSNSPRNLVGEWGISHHFPKDQFMPGNFYRRYYAYNPEAQHQLVQVMQDIYTRTREQQEAIDTFLDNNAKPNTAS